MLFSERNKHLECYWCQSTYGQNSIRCYPEGLFHPRCYEEFKKLNQYKSVNIYEKNNGCQEKS